MRLTCRFSLRSTQQAPFSVKEQMSKGDVHSEELHDSAGSFMPEQVGSVVRSRRLRKHLGNRRGVKELRERRFQRECRWDTRAVTERNCESENGSSFNILQDAVLIFYLNSHLKWNVWAQRGKGQTTLLWNLIRVCLSAQRQNRVFLRDASNRQCLGRQMQDVLWGPRSVSQRSPCQSSSQSEVFLSRKMQWGHVVADRKHEQNNGIMAHYIRKEPDPEPVPQVWYVSYVWVPVLCIPRSWVGSRMELTRFSQASPPRPVQLQALWYS